MTQRLEFRQLRALGEPQMVDRRGRLPQLEGDTAALSERTQLHQVFRVLFCMRTLT